MKKLLSILSVAIVLFSTVICRASADGGEINVYLDAERIEFDVKPQIINGRTMVPIRAIFEKMGAVVEWDGNSNSAICTKNDTVVKMTVNSIDMSVNGQPIKMDISPVVVGGRTLAPARYVAEAFGADVQWSQKNSSVVICSKNVYAYADYPDIPDLGRCYNLSLLGETVRDGFRVLSYSYGDMSNDDYYSMLYDNSAFVLGRYEEKTVDVTEGTVIISYTKSGETEPRYFVNVSRTQNNLMLFDVMIPEGKVAEEPENKVTLYAPDGRTTEVWEGEVAAYLNVGWYKTLAETQQTMYAPDGRTVTVYKSEVSAYRNVGWYETQSEATSANRTVKNTSKSNNPSADGNYYRTPTGKKYHLDPNCGGKNSYRTNDISGLSPCLKCAK